MVKSNFEDCIVLPSEEMLALPDSDPIFIVTEFSLHE